ncbi:hypothetical protein S40293_00693 [Stachybotrys chartarum IBT 40293]|nr:hypothetical protein S40293_00693 [Stachybotrys chartarum IBT 40293]
MQRGSHLGRPSIAPTDSYASPSPLPLTWPSTFPGHAVASNALVTRRRSTYFVCVAQRLLYDMEVIGTAAGVISLGFQLHGAASKYIDGFRSAKQEVRSAQALLDCLGASLEVLDSALGKIGPIDQATERSIHLCEKALEGEMKALSELLDKLKEQDPGESLRAHLREQKKKLAYPFSRENLQRLESRLGTLNTILSTALNAMSLQASVRQILAEGRRHAALQAKLDEIVTSMAAASFTKVGAPGTEVLRLLPKPAALFEAATSMGVTTTDVDEVPKVMKTTKTDLVIKESPTKICGCISRKTTRGSRRSFLWFAWVVEDHALHEHDPGCFYSRFQPPTVSRVLVLNRQSQFIKTCLATIVSYSVELSQAPSPWLSAQIRICNRVSFQASPAFRLIKLDKYFYRSCWYPEDTEMLICKALDRLFREGKASPTDVTECGSNLLHWVAHNGLVAEAATLWPMLAFLGVPEDSMDDGNRKALSILLESNSHMENLSSVLTGAGFKSHSFEPHTILPLADRLDSDICMFQLEIHLKVLSDCRMFFDWSAIGPLCTAILQQSQDKVEAILLKKKYRVLDEKFLDWPGWVTPCHLAAVVLPDAFPIIFRHIDDELRTSAGKLGSIYVDSLDLVPSLVKISKRLHRRRGRQLCEHCLCADSLEIVLQHDYPVHWDRALYADVVYAPLHIYSLVITHLADRRRRLANFAIELLPEQDLVRLNLRRNEPLHIGIEEVITLLEKRGHLIPASLTPAKLNSPIQSIFPEFWERNLSQILAQAGFRLPSKAPTPSPYAFEDWGLFYEYSQWLLENFGKSVLFQPVKLCSSETGLVVLSGGNAAISSGHVLGHYLAHLSSVCTEFHYQVGKREPLSISSPEVHLTLSLILEMATPDDCICGCSIAGCLPATIFMWTLHSDKRTGITRLRRALLFLESQGKLSLVHSALRFSIFKALGCRHTCCGPAWFCVYHRGYYDCAEWGDEKRQSIRAQDAEKLGLLEELLPEIVRQYQATGLPLWDFIHTHLRPRVSRTLKELDSQKKVQLTSQQLNQLELQLATQLGEEAIEGLEVLSDRSPSRDEQFDSDLSVVTSSAASDSESILEDKRTRRLEAVQRCINRICGWIDDVDMASTERSRADGSRGC